ncbi:hypothetical protein EZS27_000082 [termite gut metagenome]|uniref:Polymerase beta nucleotidyltransferase domain-containing protein n=1 Tax=termite gut metagenome TaxID=433724 RepID=A0A5J4T530_9ZZZZ
MRREWTREEFILTFDLYWKLTFGEFNQNNQKVQELAQLIGRTNGSVAMRLANFAACDPYHQKRGIKGLPGGLSKCQPIWDEFAENRESLCRESKRIRDELKGEKQALISNKQFINNIFNNHVPEIITLCERHKVKKLYVFGSVITNRFNNQSDIDLVVDFKEIDLIDYADNYFDLQYSLEDIFGRKVDLWEDKAIRNPILRKNIDDSKQLIYG